MTSGVITYWSNVQMQLVPSKLYPLIGTVTGTGESHWNGLIIPFKLEGDYNLFTRSMTVIKQHLDEQWKDPISYNLKLFTDQKLQFRILAESPKLVLTAITLCPPSKKTDNKSDNQKSRTTNECCGKQIIISLFF